jgi:DNA polymerase type B, organellar and viral.
VVIAHNGQGYDHQFVLNYILTETNHTPELIMRGTKIISMEMDNLKLIDSLNFLPMGVAALPKAFGIKELKKGYFPHLFNTSGNEDYIGPMPPMETYSPDTMKVEARAEFMQWYEAHKEDHFDFRKEIVDYCISDVDILTQACLKFRELLLTIGNVCPLTESCTIASACNKVFRRNYLAPDSIAIMPKGGYRWRDNQSRIAVQWMVWEERQRGASISHAAKQMEVVLNGTKVDGFCRETNEVSLKGSV